MKQTSITIIITLVVTVLLAILAPQAGVNWPSLFGAAARDTVLIPVEIPGESIVLPAEIKYVPIPHRQASSSPLYQVSSSGSDGGGTTGGILPPPSDSAYIQLLRAQLETTMQKLAQYETMIAWKDTILDRNAFIFDSTDAAPQVIPFLDSLHIAYEFPPANRFHLQNGTQRFTIKKEAPPSAPWYVYVSYAAAAIASAIVTALLKK